MTGAIGGFVLVGNTAVNLATVETATRSDAAVTIRFLSGGSVVLLAPEADRFWEVLRLFSVEKIT